MENLKEYISIINRAQEFEARISEKGITDASTLYFSKMLQPCQPWNRLFWVFLKLYYIQGSCNKQTEPVLRSGLNTLQLPQHSTPSERTSPVHCSNGPFLMVHSLCLISADPKPHQITSSFLSFLLPNLYLITIEPLGAPHPTPFITALLLLRENKNLIFISISMLRFQEKSLSLGKFRYNRLDQTNNT